jgi:type II secretion system protein G
MFLQPALRKMKILNKNLYKKSFTLIEILIVIVILGILTSLISGNFISSLKKGRDARRKSDLKQIQNALEMYYEDKKTYPTSISFGNKLCETTSCVSGEKIYMQKVPNDPNSNFTYYYQSDGTYYRLYSCIENNLDQGSGVNQSGYSGTNCGGCGVCKFEITSPNVQP